MHFKEEEVIQESGFFLNLLLQGHQSMPDRGAANNWLHQAQN